MKLGGKKTVEEGIGEKLEGNREGVNSIKISHEHVRNSSSKKILFKS